MPFQAVMPDNSRNSEVLSEMPSDGVLPCWDEERADNVGGGQTKEEEEDRGKPC